MNRFGEIKCDAVGRAERPGRQLLIAGGIGAKQDVILVAFGLEPAIQLVAGQLAREGLDGKIGGLWGQILSDGAKMVLALVWIGAVILPVVPDREGNTGEQIGQLLADDVSSLNFQGNSLAMRRISPFPAQNRQSFFLR